jgi:purine-binding chemotaxis protein CheW
MAIARTRRSSSNAHSTSRQVVFWVGGHCLALPIDGVREIVDIVQVTPVPRAPSTVLGIASLRGTVLSIIDAEQLLFGRVATSRASKVLVLIRDGAVVTGLTVDRVHGVVAIARESLIQDHGTNPTRFTLALHDLGLGDLVAELDLSTLFAHIDSQRFAASAGLPHLAGA